MPLQTPRRKGGRFLLSDTKIAEFEKAGLTPENYTTSNIYHNELVNFIITNSQISSVSSGSYGITYKLQLNSSVKSPYLKIARDKMDSPLCNTDNFYKVPCLTEVRTFLLKLSFIGKSEEYVYTIDGKIAMDKVPAEDFEREAQYQDEIYEKTFDLANSLVPACVSPALIQDIPSPLFERLKIKGGKLLKLKLSGTAQIGLILMEFAEGYRTLDKILTDNDVLNDDGGIIPKKKFSRQAANAFLLYQAAHLLLYNAGYAHGDHHYSNVMINVENKQVLLIDFGQTRNITEEPRQEFVPANFNKILKYLQDTAEQKKFLGLIKIQTLDFFQVSPLVESILAERTTKKQLILNRFRESKDETTLKFVMNPTFTNYNKLRWHLLTLHNSSNPGTPTVGAESTMESDPGPPNTSVIISHHPSFLRAVEASDIDRLIYLLNLTNNKRVEQKPVAANKARAILAHYARPTMHGLLGPFSVINPLQSKQSKNNSSLRQITDEELKIILKYKDQYGRTLLHYAAEKSSKTDGEEDIEAIKDDINNYEPKTAELKVVKALIDSAIALSEKYPNVVKKDPLAKGPGAVIYAGSGATRSYIKRRQLDAGTWTEFKKWRGWLGGTTRRRNRHASYRGSRVSRS